MDIKDIISAWTNHLDQQSAMRAALDVHTVVIGNLLPAIQSDSATVARVQAALEVFGEVASTKSPAYAAAVEEEIARLQRGLQPGAGSLPPRGG